MVTVKQRDNVIKSLAGVGISYADAKALRRISNTLNRWWMLECNGPSDGCIIRKVNEKPFFVREYLCTQTRKFKTIETPIADREKGALKRLEKIMRSYPELTAYLQTDPRGHALYILREGQTRENYSFGIAVY